MDAMEKLTSVIQPMPRVSGRSFSKLKGKDSMVLHLGMFSHGNMSGIMKPTWKLPWLTRYANEWLRHQPEMGDATWTSIAISVNAEAKPHRDVHNLAGSSNYLVTFGCHEGGEVWLRSEDDGEVRRKRKGPTGHHMKGILKPTWHKLVKFDPKDWHATMRWTGRRVALAAYTTRLVTHTNPEVLRELREHCFPLPRKSTIMSGLFKVTAEENQPEVELQEADKQEILTVLREYHGVITEEAGEDGDERFKIVELGSPGESTLKEHLEHGGIEVIPASFSEGCDLTTGAGMNRTLEFMHVVRPQWVVCYLPQGPSLTPDDPRWEQARARLLKVTRNYLKVSCQLREEGCEVLWVHSGPQRLDCFPEVREFWKYWRGPV